MAIAYNTSIVRNGLALYLDAANIKSYPGILGSELVTNSIVTQIDGTTFNVVRDGVQNIALTLCNVEAGKTYYIDYFIPTYTGTISATFRINNGGGNLTPTVVITSAGRFNAKFTANISGSLSITGDNSGTNLLVDYVSVREVLSGTGQTWFDLSGNARNGVLNNSVSFSTGTMVFDGTDDNASFGNILNMGANDFTLAAWVKSASTAVGNNNGIIYKRGTGTSASAGYRLNMPNGTFNLFIADGTNFNSLNSSLSTYNDNKWHNVVGVVSRQLNIMQLYVDGNLSSQTSITFASTIDDNNVELAVGALKLVGSGVAYHPFSGNISSANIYNRALSANEIQQNFNALRGRYNV
jgi:hypothetical protein